MFSDFNIIPFDHISYKFNAQRFADLEEFYSTEITDKKKVSLTKKKNLAYFLSKSIGKDFCGDILTNDFYANDMELLRIISHKYSIDVIEAMQCNEELSYSYEEYTSGTTGPPKKIIRSSHSVQREMLRLKYIIDYYSRYSQIKSEYRIVYVSHYPNAQSHYYLDKTSEDIEIFKIPLNSKDIDSKLQSLNLKWGRYILAGTASSLNFLLSLEQVKVVKPSLILSSGEFMPVVVKNQLSTQFNCPVYDLYVMREFGLIGFQCYFSSKFHIFENDLLISSNDNNEVLITDLTNTSQAFINYCTGDNGLLIEHVCNCNSSAFISLCQFKGREYGKYHYPPL